jgi:hypothetical protein
VHTDVVGVGGGLTYTSINPGSHSDDEEQSTTTPLLTKPQKSSGWNIYQDFLSLRTLFGSRFLVMVIAVQWFLKGFSQNFALAANPYLLRATGPISASDMQVKLALIALPWALKPLMGVTSDFLPIFGFHKLPYMALCTLIGIACCTMFLVLWPMSADQMVVTAIGVSFNTALCDLLMEARYSAKIKQHPEQGPIMISFIGAGQAGLGLAASLSSGLVIQYAGPQWSYVVPLCVCVAILCGLAGNFPQDEKIEQSACVERAKVKFEGERNMVQMALITGAVAMTFPFVGHFGGPHVKLIASLIGMVVIESALYYLIGGRIFRVVTASFVFSVLNPSIGSASYFFATDTTAQYPGGPHFTPVFYVTALGVVGGACTIVSIFVYNRYMTEWSYRTLYYIGLVFYILLSIPNVLFYLRYNLVIGIPDKWFVLGQDVIASVVFTWYNIPAFLLLSQLVKKGSEASLFSITAGVMNLGGVISSFTGAWLLYALGVEPTGEVNETDQFKNLWLAAILSNILILFLFPVVPWAIPNVSQKVNLDLDE